jgi:hypothetical protein
MAWTAPLTWVGNQLLTSTQMNTQLRDNMLQQSPALATTMSSFFMATGANALQEFQVKSARIATSESRVSSTYGDLATVGPSVTLTTRQHAIVIIACKSANTTAGEAQVMSWATSGATTNAASDTWCYLIEGMLANNDTSGCSIYRTNSLNAGTNTFTAKYRGTGTGSAFFDNRFICVMPV